MRKPTLLLLLTLPTAISVTAQKIASLHAVVGTGVSHFSGSGTVSNTILYRNGQPFPNTRDTVRNQFGKLSYANFTAGAQLNLKLPLFVLTVDALYEHSGGKITIDSLYTPTDRNKISGVHKRQYDYISINPQIGKRVVAGPAGVRLSAGIDYCIKISLGGRSDYTDLNGRKNSIGGSGDNPEVNDIRLTAGVAVNFNKWALAATYKHGLIDYSKDIPGTVFSRLLHIRLLYRLIGI